MWIAYPRVGDSVDIVYSFGKVALSSGNSNWHLVWEEK